MDRFSLSKKLAIVGILVINCLGPVSANAQGAFIDSPERVKLDERKYEEGKLKEEKEKADSQKKQCSDALKEARKARAKFSSACRKGGTSGAECSEILDDCVSNSAVEEILNPENVLSQVLGVPAQGGGRGNKCSEYSHTDYQSELKDLKREKKDIEQEIQDLQKEKIESEKEVAQRKAELQKELAQSQKDRAKEEMEEKEEERNMERARQDQEAKLKKQMRELQSQILNAQNTKAIMTASRAGEMDKYKVELLKCEAEAQKVLKSMASNTSSSLANRAAVAGSLSQAGQAKGNKKNALATLMKGCVTEVTSRRNAEAVAFQNKMKEKDEEIANAQAEMQEAQKSLQTLAQQFAQAAQDRAQKKSQEMAAYQQELKAKSDEFNNLNNEYIQTQQRIATALQKANTALTQASNELGKHEKEKPMGKGSKSVRDEMREAQSEFVGVTCSAVCKGVATLEAECDKLESDAGEMRKSMDSDGASGTK